MRLSEDGNWLLEEEYAYEVMWAWINAEISEAYPERRIVKEIPMGYKIFKHESNCKRHCAYLNKQIEPHAKRSDSNGYHPLLPIAHLFTTDD